MANRKPTQNQILSRANKCGPDLNYKSLFKFRKKKPKNMSRGERVCAFAENYIVVPEGELAGKPLRLEPFQVYFILSVFDNPHLTRKAILSVGRRSGKTFTVAVILLAFLVGPEARLNTYIASAALNRDQAAITYRMMSLMLMASPRLSGIYNCTPSSKRIVGLRKNTTFEALSADAKSGMGKSIYVLLLDESGQIVLPNNDYIDMLSSSQGSFSDSMMFTVSTQAPSDQSYLSLEIDTATRESTPTTVCHLYTMDKEADIDNESEWYYAQPALGVYRSLSDMRQLVRDAALLPAKLPGVQNLICNQRVALNALFINGQLWKDNSLQPDYEVFRKAKVVSCGIDLSSVNDLTAVVLTAKDDNGQIHVLNYAFSPLTALKEREVRDKVPYVLWEQEGHLICPPGATLNYNLICQHMKLEMDRLNIQITEIHFDKWRIDNLKNAAAMEGFAGDAQWHECQQGFISMGVRVEGLETLLLERRIRHGLNPVLTMAASHAIVIQDSASNKKLCKKSSSQKIDSLVALAMSIYPFVQQQQESVVDISALVG